MAEKKEIKKTTNNKEEAKEKVKEEAAKTKTAAAITDADADSIDPNPKRQRKKERREAKAARKAANMVEEKKSRPNNILLAVLIFGVIVAMFAFVAGYNYFQKPASLEAYIEQDGGEESYGNVQMDGYTVANITASGNSMKIEMTAEVEESEEEIINLLKENYSGDEGLENLESIAAYFLTGMKPSVRGFGGDVEISMTLNGDELNSTKLTYSEAKKVIKRLQEEGEDEDLSDDAEIDLGDDIEIDDGDIVIDTDDTETEADGEDAE